MEGSIIFYTYGSTLELNGQQFEAGRLTEDLLNLSPDDYHPLHERMVRIRTLMDIYEYVRKSELWWKLNDEMEQLCQELRRYTVFRLLPDDCYDAFFSVIREITGQFSLFPPEEHSLSEDDQTKLLSASAEEFFQSDDGDSDPEISLGLLDLFRRREGSEEKGELFYRDFLRQGPRSVALENGRMAQVFYVPAAGAVTEVEVPEGCCQISGDNVEGFILTWWGDTHENG